MVDDQLIVTLTLS